MIDPIATTKVQTTAPRRAAGQQAPPEAPAPQDGFTAGTQSSAPVTAVNQQQPPAPEFPRPMTDDEKADFKSWFPALDVDAAVVTADATPQYNCISWTTGNTESWDWPPYMHPDLSPREAFAKYYIDRGFTPLPGKIEDLKELKSDVVAYWEDANDDPTHGSVAGPTHGTRWESKCGQAARIQQELLDILGQALTIREVDAGSCNGCELEINALGNPYYNLQGLGIKFVASPRHADMLLVTGPVSRNMETALKRTYEATPEPKLVVAVGDCACDGGIFGESYATCGRVANVIPVDEVITGCPPAPLEILRGILKAVRRRVPAAD